MVIENGDVFKKKNNLVLRSIHDSYFIIDITDNYMNDKCVLYEINEVGTFIWKKINCKNNLETIAQELFNAIVDDVDFQDIASDTFNFISELVRNGLIERV